jgi:hypothetical protein
MLANGLVDRSIGVPRSSMADVGGVRLPHEDDRDLDGHCVSSSLPVRLAATLCLRRTGDQEAIEAALHGELAAQRPAGWMIVPERAADPLRFAPQPSAPRPTEAARERIDVRRTTTGGLDNVDPLAWIQLLDDRGAALCSEIFVGHRLDVAYAIQARVTLLARAHAHVAAGRRTRSLHQGGMPGRAELVHGVYARLLLRTIHDRTGPRFRVDAVVLPLLAAGHSFRFPHAGRCQPPTSLTAREGARR